MLVTIELAWSIFLNIFNLKYTILLIIKHPSTLQKDKQICQLILSYGLLAARFALSFKNQVLYFEALQVWALLEFRLPVLSESS
jgi:hypothetical protein